MPAPRTTAQASDDEQLLHLAVSEAGAHALQLSKQSVASWNKSDGTPVSDADMAVNDLLFDKLAANRPEYGWLSEETTDTPERLKRKRVWVVDPIDGTSAFLKGGEHWCIACALIENGRPVLGAVFAPVTGKLFTASAGGGAWLNGKKISTTRRTRLEGARMIAHSKILSPERWHRPWPPVETGMATSIALRLCFVASGQYDATVAIGGKSDWDLVAGDLIVHEAGGKMSALDGNTMYYNKTRTRQNGLVACGTRLHEEIISYTTSLKTT